MILPLAWCLLLFSFCFILCRLYKKEKLQATKTVLHLCNCNHDERHYGFNKLNYSTIIWNVFFLNLEIKKCNQVNCLPNINNFQVRGQKSTHLCTTSSTFGDYLPKPDVNVGYRFFNKDVMAGCRCGRFSEICRICRVFQFIQIKNKL